MREITTDECKLYLETSAVKPLLLDVREPWEYNIVNLQDSRSLPMRQVPAELDSLGGPVSRQPGLQQRGQPAWWPGCLGTRH
jgi:rhodanese-related sulfurtransferase